jgi:protein-L-isoaspartate(D-aspartate) O-methyltransferase
MEKEPKKFESKKKRLLDSLIVNELLTDKRLYQAFMDVPLEEFIPRRFRDNRKLYEDIPNLFYYRDRQNYRTISAPHMITIMLQGLALEPDDDLLILGAKSGYIAALAHNLAPEGEIIVLEANSEIANLTKDNLEKLGLGDNISVIVKNPLEGMPELSPWQKILVTGAIQQDRLSPLLRQLDPDEGVLYAPIGQELIQNYTQILRIDQDYYGKRKLQVRFTPLMTQIEIDDLELITDYDELQKDIEVEINPEKVERTLKKSEEKYAGNVDVKYETKILDELSLKEEEEGLEEIDPEIRDEIVSYMRNIVRYLRRFKKEENLDKCFSYLDSIEENLNKIKEFKKEYKLKAKKIQNLVNEIRTYTILRKELKDKELSEGEEIEKKIEIINKKMERLNDLKQLLSKEVERLRSL